MIRDMESSLEALAGFYDRRGYLRKAGTVFGEAV
jgi:hypothetical protein